MGRDIFRRSRLAASFCLKRNNASKTFVLGFDYDTNALCLFYKYFVFSAHGAYYTIMLRPNYVAYKNFFAEFLRDSTFLPRGTQHN